MQSYDILDTEDDPIDLMSLILSLTNDTDEIISLISKKSDKLNSDSLLFLVSRKNISKDIFLSILSKGIANDASPKKAKKILSYVSSVNDGDIIEFEHQRYHLIMDEGIIKILPREVLFGYINTILPMYLITKYPQHLQMRNTSIFMIHEYVYEDGKSIHQFKYMERLDETILKRLEYTDDFTKDQLLSIDYHAIIMIDRFWKRRTLIY